MSQTFRPGQTVYGRWDVRTANAGGSGWADPRAVPVETLVAYTVDTAGEEGARVYRTDGSPRIYIAPADVMTLTGLTGRDYVEQLARLHKPVADAYNAARPEGFPEARVEDLGVGPLVVVEVGRGLGYGEDVNACHPDFQASLTGEPNDGQWRVGAAPGAWFFDVPLPKRSTTREVAQALIGAVYIAQAAVAAVQRGETP